MSYRRHVASENVLADPGERDISAHVCFTVLQQDASPHGFDLVRFESLARLLLSAARPAQFAQALAGETGADITRRRLQRKTSLFGMGETSRTLLMSKGTLQPLG